MGSAGKKGWGSSRCVGRASTHTSAAWQCQGPCTRPWQHAAAASCACDAPSSPNQSMTHATHLQTSLFLLTEEAVWAITHTTKTLVPRPLHPLHAQRPPRPCPPVPPCPPCLCPPARPPPSPPPPNARTVQHLHHAEARRECRRQARLLHDEAEDAGAAGKVVQGLRPAAQTDRQ